MNCPRLDIPACSYLLLAQNQQQSIFQFEIYSHFVFADTIASKRSPLQNAMAVLANTKLPFHEFVSKRLLARLDRSAAPFLNKPMDVDACLEPISQIVRAHDAWLKQLPRDYGNWSLEAAPTIVVTETPFDSDYYSIGSRDSQIAVVSIAKWQKGFAPPSVLEFVLWIVQRYSLLFVADLGSHYATRGCVWDFTANVSDARVGVALGYLCDACEQEVSRRLQPVEMQELKNFLSHKWIGKSEEPGTVASNIKRIFSYDLARTKGVSPGFWDRFLDVLTSETIKVVVATLLTILTFLVGLLIGRQTHPEQQRPKSDMPQFRYLSISQHRK